jgi:hypothetical protein
MFTYKPPPKPNRFGNFDDSQPHPYGAHGTQVRPLTYTNSSDLVDADRDDEESAAAFSILKQSWAAYNVADEKRGFSPAERSLFQSATVRNLGYLPGALAGTLALLILKHQPIVKIASVIYAKDLSTRLGAQAPIRIVTDSFVASVVGLSVAFYTLFFHPSDETNTYWKELCNLPLVKKPAFTATFCPILINVYNAHKLDPTFQDVLRDPSTRTLQNVELLYTNCKQTFGDVNSEPMTITAKMKRWMMMGK